MGIIAASLKALLESLPSVPEQQRSAAKYLPQILGPTSLHLWKAGDQIYPYGTRFLIGIATWSGLDWETLDKLAESASGRLHRVDIFNADDARATDYRTQPDFEEFVPGIGVVHHTPVVGRWQDGILVDKASGFKGRVLLENWFGVSLNSKATDR